MRRRRRNNNNINNHSIVIYTRAGLTAKMPIIKPAQKHKYNTKAAQIHKINTKQTNKKNNIAGKDI
jgi:hypothetical protein